MEQSFLLKLPYVMPSQAQKHVTHNEALQILDALVHLAVLARSLSEPPAMPGEGDRYIVGPAASGAWAGKEGWVAARQDGAWTMFAPRSGWMAWVAGEGAAVVYDGDDWVNFEDGVRALHGLSHLGVGTTADDTNRLAAKLNAALFTARPVSEGGDGNLRYVLNKDAAPDTLSLIFQAGYSGHAEFGLIGNNDVALKVSPDGSDWITALEVDRSSGHILIPEGVAVGDAVRLVAVGEVPEDLADGMLWVDAGGRLLGHANGRTAPLDFRDLPMVEPDAGRWLRGCPPMSTTTTAQAGVADRIFLYPYMPRFDGAVDRLGVNVTAAVAGSTVKLLVYGSDARGRPADLRLETGDLSCATTGAKEAEVVLDLQAGRQVWLGVRTSGAQTLSAWQAYNSPELDAPGIATGSYKSLQRTLAYATPAPVTWVYTADDAATGFAPAVWLRTG